MGIGQVNAALRNVSKLVTSARHSVHSDGDLLRRFSAHQDQAAFRALLQRHGPMVYGVCCRTLHDPHDAEDVLQATFLVLLKKAAALRGRDSVAGWLHEVAHRLALKAKSEALRRGVKERRAAAKESPDPVDQLTVREAQAVLHEELHRLTETLRAPLVLCYLESATQDEAARQLGWSVRTLKRRLQRGRDILHRRLLRRGLTLSAALSAGLLTPRSEEHV